MRIAAISLIAFSSFALSSLVWAAPDLNDTYKELTAAVEAKNPAQVKALANQTSKEAKELAKEAQPAEADAVEAWKARQKFAKDADDYSEYALSAVGMQVPASLVDLTDALIAQNPKSKHIDTVAPYYLQALTRLGGAKASAGAQKILAANPEQEDALMQLAGNPQYANKLVQVMRTKPKPEGVSEADWDRKKSQMITNGTYMGAVGPCSRSVWAECDRAMKAAEPVLKGTSMAGTMYFYLGVANYQMGSLTADKSKMREGLRYSQQSAGIAGPMQGQAGANVAAMSKAVGAGK